MKTSVNFYSRINVNRLSNNRAQAKNITSLFFHKSWLLSSAKNLCQLSNQPYADGLSTEARRTTRWNF